MFRLALSAAALAALSAHPVLAQTPKPMPRPAAEAPARPQNLVTSVTLDDLGFGDGFRFSNLGGRRELFVPLPQGADLVATELSLVLDDLSAYEARRSLEILVNDRSAAAIALDGRSQGRVVRVPLRAKPRDGFLKLAFSYSGAATQDRCIDVRSVGDSLTLRPESGLDIEIAQGSLDVATTTALLPRKVALVFPERRLAADDIATGLTVARALRASGRQVSYHRGFGALAELARREDGRRIARGIVAIGKLNEVAPYLDAPLATVAGPLPEFGTLAAIRAGGQPGLLIADTAKSEAARLFSSSALAATRGSFAASAGATQAPRRKSDRITFDTLGVTLPQADVFGRAEMPVSLAMRNLPEGMRAARLVLDIMVAPDGAGEKAVVSGFVNERLLGSAVAASGEKTQLDLALPDGLVGTSASLRVVVQRRSAQGDCRFEPQGYPAQILGSSALVLEAAGERPHDFADLSAWWRNGIEVVLSADSAIAGLGAPADILAALSPAEAPISVRLVPGEAPAPASPFLAVSMIPPAGSTPRVAFDRGRVGVSDKSGRKLLDLGALGGGAVAQLVTSGGQPGLWIRPLAADGTLPAPPEVKLERGDVAFVDKSGVALAMSTTRDTLLRVDYPDQVTWLSIAERMRAWMIGGLWLLATLTALFAVQRMMRRRAKPGE